MAAVVTGQLDVANIKANKDEVVLSFSYLFKNYTVKLQLALPIALNTFLRPTTTPDEDICRLWNLLTEPTLKVFRKVDRVPLGPILTSTSFARFIHTTFKGSRRENYTCPA
ncbi:AP-2 complex subunit alpha-2-like protein [Corchorus olitorius]|uniref:AP-2 complex subunit alpha-2-like protein n=1 Tax=Corchorus olitorius TaxID=93759 RepID=A0A1R3J812_9ROSI|nr:AP-2 complex subunit alpha-2-like protein [Corchorus olitorius]